MTPNQWIILCECGYYFYLLLNITYISNIYFLHLTSYIVFHIMKLNAPYHRSKQPVTEWSKRYLHSSAAARPLLMINSAGLCYLDKCEMVRAVYGCEMTIDETTGQLIDIMASCSSIECIGLKLGEAVMKVIPVLFKSDEVPSWAISSAATTTLDLPALQQNNIDITSVNLGHSVKIALVPLGVAITFHTGEPVDNLNMAEPDDVSLLRDTHSSAVAEWATALDNALKKDNYVIAHEVLAFLRNTPGEEGRQLGSKAAEFANLTGLEPTLMSLNMTSISHPLQFKTLLDRLGGPEKPVAPIMTVSSPLPPSTITILDKASEREEVLFKNGHMKNTITYLSATINEKGQTLDNVSLADPTAAMKTILALKTGEEKSDGIVSLFITNAKQQKADPANEYNAKLQKRDNENYDRVLGTAFISGNVSSHKMDSMNKTTNQSGLSFIHFGKHSKAISEAVQQEGQRQMLEAAIGETEGNATKKRTTFHPVDFFHSLDQVACLLANFMNCIEAAYICSSSKQPVVYQVAERYFKFCIDPKSIEWCAKNFMPGLPMFVVSLMDEEYTSASETGSNYINKLAAQAGKPEDLVIDRLQTTTMKVLETLREITKKRDWGTIWSHNDLPAWIRNMKEIAEPEVGSSTSTRTSSPSKRKFDKPAGETPSTSGMNVSWRDTAPGRGAPPPTVPGQATHPPAERGRLRESGDGGSFSRPPSRNGCYLLLSTDTKPELALCPEARSQYCGHHAVVHKTCIDRACKKDHKWWHEYSEELKTKQLQYMTGNPTVVKFSPKASATIRALPSGNDHLIGGEN